MPISESLAAFDRDALHEEARAHFNLKDGERMVLVSGGSLGAVRLSRAAADLAGRWRDRTHIRLVIKAGRDQLPAIEQQPDSSLPPVNMPRESRQSIADDGIGFLETPGMNEHLRAHVPEIGILGIAVARGFEYLQGFVNPATLFMNEG